MSGAKIPTVDWSKIDAYAVFQYVVFGIVILPAILLFMIMFGPMMIAYKGIELLSVGISNARRHARERRDQGRHSGTDTSA